METEEPVRAFGTWDAPMTDDAVWVDVPKDKVCMYCHRFFQDGDNGAISPTGWGQHRECSLRGVTGGIGHHVNHERYCHGELGPDAGLDYRLSAMLVWNLIVEGAPCSEAILEMLAGREPNTTGGMES